MPKSWLGYELVCTRPCPFYSYSCEGMCVCVWSSLSADWASTGYGCQSYLWSAEQGKWNFLFPVLLRAWVSFVPCWAAHSPHNQAESSAIYRGSTSPFRFPLRFPLEPLCAIGLAPSLSGHPILHYRWRSLPRTGTGPIVLKAAR